MKISLDAGAVCINSNLHFGNYTFTQSLIESIQKFDSANVYYAYSFCDKPKWLKTSDRFNYQILKPATLWLSTRVSIEEAKSRKDTFLALNQAIPLYTKSKIISFSHGLSFYYFPQYYPDSYHALKDQLGPMVKKSSYLVVPSRRVKNEMEKIFPKFKKLKINNYGVPLDMVDYQPANKKKYFLFVGMNHTIKNINFLVKAFKIFRQSAKNSSYKLFLVGDLGQFENEEEGIYTFADVTRTELKKLYAEATACLTASFYESFNFPVLEALSQNCPVIGLDSAIIPEFREFVYLAFDTGDFVNQMIAATKNKSFSKHRETVLKRFSWKKYVAKLVELY